MKRLLLVLSCLIACAPATLLAWSNHSLGTWLALADLEELRQAEPVQVESLEAFLAAEGVALEQLLDEQEAFAREHFPGYPARPDDLRWLPGSTGDRRRAFLMALRVNPEIRLASFVQALPGLQLPDHRFLGAEQVLVFRKLNLWNEWRFIAVEPGERLNPLAVLASAADEPDYGHDINLFSDNPGEVGGRYGFGTQPFGDARFEYSSQAPFHIGYYHESALIYRAAPFLARTYPEMRVQQYLGLARFAFESGHDYWGYRFLGWALHYVQDLTQPYHSKALPGENTATLMWTAIKAALGHTADKEAAIERVATRHTEVEKYQADWLRRLLREGSNDSPLLAAYRDRSVDGDYPPFDLGYLRDVVSLEAYDAADGFDERIGAWLAKGQPGADFTQGNQLKPPASDPQLDAVLVQLIRHFSGHSRNLVRTTLRSP
ncbi:phospholipase [Pseudomonas tohonis]|nr:phospholipase [Pseudomonas tohonis]UXY54384.1 phospholipase [Pseudomonas tohonis]